MNKHVGRNAQRFRQTAWRNASGSRPTLRDTPLQSFTERETNIRFTINPPFVSERISNHLGSLPQHAGRNAQRLRQSAWRNASGFRPALAVAIAAAAPSRMIRHDPKLPFAKLDNCYLDIRSHSV